MNQIKIVSFDAEGTLVTPDFSQAIWHGAIPALYAEKQGLEFEQAKKAISNKYAEVGDQRIEWYNIRYWFNLLGLGAPEPVIERCLEKASCYPEVSEILSTLKDKYELVVASGTPIELLHYLLRDIELYFSHVFSSISHYQQIKSPEFYLSICRELEVEPGELAHVGDNWQFDFLNPKQIGINAFYLDRSGNNHRESIANLTQVKYLLNTI
ncbi:MAG: HAD family hydrolase [Chloroflexota bacterium]|nr:HAD family hydrolase [Chloroflexota bacterium]